MSNEPAGKKLLLNPAAESADSALPPFIARPAGAPVYHGFAVLPESCTNGWCFGVISDCTDPEGCDWGDAYVVAPDGTRAGIVWQVGEGSTYEVLPPDANRWGVYGLWFPALIRTTADIVAAFRLRLPELQAIHARVSSDSRTA